MVYEVAKNDVACPYLGKIYLLIVEFLETVGGGLGLDLRPPRTGAKDDRARDRKRETANRV